MDKYIIRRATPNDAKIIATITRNTFIDTFGKDNTKEDMEIFLTQDWTMEFLMKQVIDDLDIFLLVFEKDTTCKYNTIPIGYCRIALSEKEERNEEIFKNKNILSLARIYVIKEYQGCGIGKLLMNNIISIANDLSMDYLWLGVWEHNPKAIQFYKHLGFIEFGNHVFKLGNDPQKDLLFYKSLK